MCQKVSKPGLISASPNVWVWTTNALRKVNVNAMIVDQYALHLEVCLLAVFLLLEFDECVLQAVSRPLVPDDLTRQNFAESTENEI